MPDDFESKIADFHHYYSSLSAENQAFVDRLSKRFWSYAGDIILLQDETSDCVYIIEEGSVEVIIETAAAKSTPPITYLGRGDIIGELGVMNKSTRSATVKAAMDVHYRRIEAADFLVLLHELPSFAAFIAHRLALRLANTTSSLAFSSVCMDLSGKLPQFDLTSVFYTITNSWVTGELRIVDEGRETLGNFFIQEGKLSHARYRHLQGSEAIWQLFIENDLVGAFSFKHSDSPSRPVDESQVLDYPLDDLLMQSALIRDGFQNLDRDIKAFKGELRRGEVNVDTPGIEVDEPVSRMLELTERGTVQLSSIWPLSGLSNYSFSKTVQQLRDAGVLIHSV
ncbi:MAG: cyclic nucleotide-binding domain-containing protein [Verrucomicrobiota bacterium]